MPSLLILDDVHLMCPAPGDSPEGPGGNGSAALVEWLCDVLDSFRPPGKPVLPGILVDLTTHLCFSSSHHQNELPYTCSADCQFDIILYAILDSSMMLKRLRGQLYTSTVLMASGHLIHM